MGTFTTSGSPTLNGDGTCTIDGTDRVKCPEAQTILDETSGWLAACVKPTWASSGSLPGSTPHIFQWGDGNFDHEIVVRFGLVNRVDILRGVLNADETVAAQTGTWAANDPIVIVAKWSATLLYVSVQGQAFASTGNTSIPTVASADIDIGNYLAGDRPLLSPIAWIAAGSGAGLPTDADAATLSALGATDVTWTTISGVGMKLRGLFNDFTYETSATTDLTLPAWPRIRFNG